MSPPFVYSSSTLNSNSLDHSQKVVPTNESLKDKVQYPLTPFRCKNGNGENAYYSPRSDSTPAKVILKSKRVVAPTWNSPYRVGWVSSLGNVSQSRSRLRQLCSHRVRYSRICSSVATARCEISFCCHRSSGIAKSSSRSKMPLEFVASLDAPSGNSPNASSSSSGFSADCDHRQLQAGTAM